MSEEPGEDLCKRVAGSMGCKMDELRDKPAKEIIHAIYSIYQADYPDKEILQIIKRLERAGRIRRDVHEELGPPEL